jgi:hypothetical protein
MVAGPDIASQHGTPRSEPFVSAAISPSRGAPLTLRANVKARSFALAFAVLVAICAPSAYSRASADPKLMVLQLSDLPSGFSRGQARYVSNHQALRESTVKKNYAKLGRINGYEAVFTKHGAPLTGILQVNSTASTYKTAAGAQASLRISEVAAGRSRPRFRRLSVGTPLGDEARLLTATVRQGGVTVDVYSLIWRSGSVYATVLAGALTGTGSPAQVVALAKKQQKRIVAATR